MWSALVLVLVTAVTAVPQAQATVPMPQCALPRRRPRTVSSPGEALAALRRDGAFLLPSGTVDPQVVARLDRWLADSSEALPSSPVRSPRLRRHRLPLPGDAGGEVATAVAAIVRAISAPDGTGALHSQAVLAELGAFVVSPGAAEQVRMCATRGGGSHMQMQWGYSSILSASRHWSCKRHCVPGPPPRRVLASDVVRTSTST
jgi:hypothetical protein